MGGKKGGAPAFLLPVPISGWIRIVMLARAKLIWSWFRFVAGVSNNGTYDRPKKFHNSYSTPFCSSCIFHYTPTISRSVSESDLNIWVKIVYVCICMKCVCKSIHVECNIRSEGSALLVGARREAAWARGGGQRSSCSASPCVREKRRTGERSTGEEGEAGRLGWIDLIRSKSSLIDDGVRGKIGSSSAQ